MKHRVYQLRFLTPALLAGANPKSLHGATATAEMRAASIRGQLRWWHRFLGFGADAEKRIYGSVAGDSGRASGVLVRVIDPPESIDSPQTAANMGLQESGQIVEYLAFNLRKREDARSNLPVGIPFHVLLQTRNLSVEDQATLDRTMEIFGHLGALGTRSRRCFGALALEEINGRSATRLPVDDLLRNTPAKARLVETVSDSDWREFFKKAGRWLREKRGSATNKKVLFGTAGSNQRRASSILLRPWLEGRNMQLLIIGRSKDLDNVL